MAAEPAEMPVTILVEPTVAMVVLLLIQEPPAVVSPSVVVAPVQTQVVPVIAAGSGLTVMVIVVLQPVGNK